MFQTAITIHRTNNRQQFKLSISTLSIKYVFCYFLDFFFRFTVSTSSIQAYVSSRSSNIKHWHNTKTKILIFLYIFRYSSDDDDDIKTTAIIDEHVHAIIYLHSKLNETILSISKGIESS